MRKLDNKISDELYDNMGILDSETLNESNKYKIKCFSVFDQWLTEEKMQEQILFYQEALDSHNKEYIQKYYEYHDRFISFYIDLYKKTTVYGMLAQEYSGSRIGVEFDSIDEYKSHVLMSVREQLFLKIALPEFHSVIMGNFDLTHMLYILKSKPEGFQGISKIIKDNNLFILD